MTDRTFTFTIEQIKDIYRAGIRRGEEVQCAYDWGSSPSSGQYSELCDAIHDIVNAEKQWGAPDYTEWGVIEGWFK